MSRILSNLIRPIVLSPAAEAMLRNRNELKSLFKNNSRLSETHFAQLIDSMLNKRDDQFHGVWKPGRTYRPGDVVIYGGALWIMAAGVEICSHPDQPPSKQNSQWSSLIIPVDDEDWEVVQEEGVMWAKVYEKIGIGIGSLEGERPEARLDIRKKERGRWLLFPEQSEQTQFSLLHYASSVENSYLTTGLSLEEVNWLSDAAKGFVFRKGRVLTEEAEALELTPTDGQVLMVIKPKRIQGGAELATLGLNVEDPVAMLDISDGDRGQLLFTPEEKRDPALTIINLDPKTDKNYLALGVGVEEAAFVSDAPNGFVFRQGSDYGTYCAEKSINQGNLLMLMRQSADPLRPQVGIGTQYPRARLEVVDRDRTQIQLLPELPAVNPATPPTAETAPVISLLNLQPANKPTYLTSGLSGSVAGWVTNAEQGFVFRQGGAASVDANPQRLDQGKTHLVIREDGRIGMGTENPYTKLEIVNESGSGKFLFNLDQKVNPALGIVNLRPGSKENYLTIGADNNHALLVTDSQYGFLFRAGREYNQNDSQIDVNQGDTLVSIRPEGRGRMGIGKLPINYELDVHGMARVLTLYQDTNESLITKQKPLTGALRKVRDLRPISFEWTAATGFQAEGEQLGLLAHEVDDVFPQVVKTASDGTKAIAYQNLVPALIQSIQELIDERNQTQRDLETLRNEFTGYQQQMGDRLQALSDRLERLERHNP
jgi:hypothetical protein